MTALRYLIVYLVLSAFAVRPAYAERLKINYVFPPDRPVDAAKLHGTGALIGGAAATRSSSRIRVPNALRWPQWAAGRQGRRFVRSRTS